MFLQKAKDRANDTVILVERGAARDEADRVPCIDEAAEFTKANTQLLTSDSQTESMSARVGSQIAKISAADRSPSNLLRGR